MKAARRPHVFTAPFLEMRKFFPEYSACPAFQSFGYKTERILWRIFKENMYMVWIYRNFDYLYTQFFAGFADNAFCNHCDIPDQYFPSIFRGENQMIRQQRHCMPVVAKSFATCPLFHSLRNNLYPLKHLVRAE
jgi:hypothetical protein